MLSRFFSSLSPSRLSRRGTPSRTDSVQHESDEQSRTDQDHQLATTTTTTTATAATTISSAAPKITTPTTKRTSRVAKINSNVESTVTKRQRLRFSIDSSSISANNNIRDDGSNNNYNSSIQQKTTQVISSLKDLNNEYLLNADKQDNPISLIYSSEKPLSVTHVFKFRNCHPCNGIHTNIGENGPLSTNYNCVFSVNLMEETTLEDISKTIGGGGGNIISLYFYGIYARYISRIYNHCVSNIIDEEKKNNKNNNKQRKRKLPRCRYFHFSLKNIPPKCIVNNNSDHDHSIVFSKDRVPSFYSICIGDQVEHDTNSITSGNEGNDKEKESTLVKSFDDENINISLFVENVESKSKHSSNLDNNRSKRSKTRNKMKRFTINKKVVTDYFSNTERSLKRIASDTEDDEDEEDEGVVNREGEGVSGTVTTPSIGEAAMQSVNTNTSPRHQYDVQESTRINSVHTSETTTVHKTLYDKDDTYKISRDTYHTVKSLLNQANTTSISSKSTYNCFAIVMGFTPARLLPKSGDWIMTLTLMDDSMDGNHNHNILSMNIFAGYDHKLPKVIKMGDVLICHKISMQKYKGNLQLVGKNYSQFVVCRPNPNNTIFKNDEITFIRNQQNLLQRHSARQNDGAADENGDDILNELQREWYVTTTSERINKNKSNYIKYRHCERFRELWIWGNLYVSNNPTIQIDRQRWIYQLESENNLLSENNNHTTHSNSNNNNNNNKNEVDGDMTVMITDIIPNYSTSSSDTNNNNIPNSKNDPYKQSIPYGFLRVWDGTGYPKSAVDPVTYKPIHHQELSTVLLQNMFHVVSKINSLADKNNNNQQIIETAPEYFCGQIVNVIIWEHRHWKLVIGNDNTDANTNNDTSSFKIKIGQFIRMRNIHHTIYADKLSGITIHNRSSLIPVPDTTYEVRQILLKHAQLIQEHTTGQLHPTVDNRLKCNPNSAVSTIQQLAANHKKEFHISTTRNNPSRNEEGKEESNTDIQEQQPQQHLESRHPNNLNNSQQGQHNNNNNGDDDQDCFELIQRTRIRLEAEESNIRKRRRRRNQHQHCDSNENNLDSDQRLFCTLDICFGERRNKTEFPVIFKVQHISPYPKTVFSSKLLSSNNNNNNRVETPIHHDQLTNLYIPNLQWTSSSSALADLPSQQQQQQKQQSMFLYLFQITICDDTADLTNVIVSNQVAEQYLFHNISAQELHTATLDASSSSSISTLQTVKKVYQQIFDRLWCGTIKLEYLDFIKVYTLQSCYIIDE